jgi:hypothetical protein
MKKVLLMMLALVLTIGAEAQRGDRRPPRGGKAERTMIQIDTARLAAKYDVLPKLDHPETCVQSFTDERIGWVFGNR